MEETQGKNGEDPQHEGEPQMGTDTLEHQDDDPKTQKETNGGTNTEDTLRERAPYWMHKERKKLGLKKRQ